MNPERPWHDSPRDLCHILLVEKQNEKSDQLSHSRA